MEIIKTSIEGLLVLKPRVFQDERGFFFESYNEARFREAGLFVDWKQDNHSKSVARAVRGLHYLRGEGQNKIVRCVAGSIWDVAVDIRPESPTFAQWHGVELSAENKKMLLLSKGFAHGYAVLSDWAEVLYKCDTLYDPALEAEIKWNDPDLSIDWPVETPILSARDKEAQSFQEYLKDLKSLSDKE